MIEILNRWTRARIYSSATATTIAKAVSEARKNGANLSYADLAGAYLSGADLAGSFHLQDVCAPFPRGGGCVTVNVRTRQFSVIENAKVRVVGGCRSGSRQHCRPAARRAEAQGTGGPDRAAGGGRMLILQLSCPWHPNYQPSQSRAEIEDSCAICERIWELYLEAGAIQHEINLGEPIVSVRFARVAGAA